MPDQAEYNDLVYQQKCAEEQARQARQRLARYQERAERLKPVYRRVYALKHEDFDAIIKKDENIVSGSYEWIGSRYDSFQRDGEDVRGENNRYRDNSLDMVLDALNDEITRYENLCMEEYGLIGRLGAKINSLINRIENYFN